MPPKPRSRSRRISDKEIRIVLDWLGFVDGAGVETAYDEVAVAFLIALETAMRASEIVTLTWDQVFLSQSYVHLSDTKNGDERDVPLSSRAVELFGLLPDNRDQCFSINAATLSTLFRRARVESGLSGFTFHDSRREALTRLSRKVNVLQLAKMVGHRNPKSLMIYYQESASEIAKLLG
jgi:integrase